jgi:GntR family transcriptional regulator, phosphonate transport system regulatory protein
MRGRCKPEAVSKLVTRNPPIDQMEGRCDRGASPIWRRLADRVRAGIEAGDFKRGSRLPGEHELARSFGVNRHTVRQAIRSLVEEGLVQSRRGRGNFVSEISIDYQLGDHTRFSSNLLAQDRTPERLITSVETGLEEPSIAGRLALSPDRALSRFTSIGLADGVPVVTSETWIEAARFPDIEDALRQSASITDLFRRHGITDYRRRLTRILARLPTADEALSLRQPASRPVLVTEALDVDAQAIPLSWARAVWAAERVHFSLETS